MNTETILLITIVLSIIAIVTLALHPKVSAGAEKPLSTASAGKSFEGMRPAGSISLTAITAAPSLDQLEQIHAAAVERFEDDVLADVLVAGTKNQHHAGLVLTALQRRQAEVAEQKS